jgi:hypothetical protein
MKAGDLVVYVPSHATDIFDAACEVGVINSFNGSGNAAFVRYYLNNILQSTSQATALVDLKPFPFKVGDQCTAWWNSNDTIYTVVEIDIPMLVLRNKKSSGIDFQSRHHFRDIRPTRGNKIKNFLENEA